MSQNQPNRGVAVAVMVALLLIALTRTFFVVRVDQFAIVTQFGKPTQEIETPGLYFRIPLVQEVKYLDQRIRGWDDSQKDTKTSDSRQIDYTVYARWQIADPLTFYMAVGNEKRAHAVMDSIVTGRIQTKIRNNRLASIVRETGRPFEARASVDPRSIFDVYQECNPAVNPEFGKTLTSDGRNSKEGSTGEQAEALRSKLVMEILEEANKELIPGYGLKLRDVHFKYLNYAEQVHNDIIKQIQADRKDDISAYLEIGQKCVGYINRITDAERGEIIGSGEARVRQLDGEAVAKAIDIKARAFGRAPQLYSFLKNLDLVEAALDPETRLILSAKSPLLQAIGSSEAAIELPPLDDAELVPTEIPEPAPRRVVPAPTPEAQPAAEPKAEEVPSPAPAAVPTPPTPAQPVPVPAAAQPTDEVESP